MSLGTLTIEMAANVARLQTDMKRAADAVESATSQMRKAAGLAAGALAAIGVGLSVSAFTGFIRGAIDAADAMAKISQKTGMAVKDIAGLQLAYQQSGLGADMFEKTMARMSRTMAEGNKAFAAMGVSVRDTSGQLRPMKDVLGDVADKFASYADGAEKTALAQEIFGKAGADMIPLLNGGAEALQQMDEWAQKLGLTFDQETAKKAEEFNDTLDLLNMGLQGVGRQIAAEMLPTLTSLAGELLTTATESGALRTAAGALGVMLKGTYTIAASGIQIFANLGRVVGGAGAAIAAILRGDFAGAKGIMEQVKLDNTAAWTAQMDSIKRLWSGVGNEGVAAMATVTAAAKKAAPEMEKPGKAAKKAMKEAKDEAMELYQKLTMKDIGLDPKFYADLQKLHGLYTSGRIGIEQYRGAVEQLIGQQQFAKDLAREEADALKKLADAQKAMADARKREAAEYDRTLQSIKDGNAQLRLEIDTLGMSRRERTAYNQALNQASIAKLQDKLATLQLFGAEEELLQAVRDQIAALEDRNALMGRMDDAQDMQEALQQQVSTWQSIERTAHDVFVNIFEDGAGTFKRLGQTLKAALLDWLYQLTVRRWIINIGASLSGSPGGFLQAFGGQGGGGLLGTAQNAGSLWNMFSGVGGNWGALQGFFGGTMSFANAAGSIAANTMASYGMYGGNSMSAFLATNGAYGTAAGGAAGGAAGLAAAAAVVAVPLIIGAIAESRSRDRYGGAAYATSDYANDPLRRVAAGSTAWSPSSDLPDYDALLDAIAAMGFAGDRAALHDKFQGNARMAMFYLDQIRDFDPNDEWSHLPNMDDYNIADFYRGRGYADPQQLGWWNHKEPSVFPIDPEIVAASRAIAESVVAPLTDMARMLGDESDFRVTAGFANRGKGALWGAMAIERDGQTIVDMERADYKNAEEYMRAVYRGAMDAFKELDLPEWAKGQVAGAQSAMAALEGDKVGQEAAAIYSQATANIAQLYQSIKTLIDVFPDFADATQDSMFALQELMGGMDNLQQAYSSYLQNFWTEEERASLLRRQVELEFERIGLAMPASRDAFRALVEAQDLSTEAGREAFAALMGVAGAFAELTNASVAAFAEANIAQLYQSIKTLIDVFPDFADATQDSLFALQELMGGMDNLQQAYSAYLQNYWTEEERASLLRRQVELEFERIGLAMPASRDAFRALVEAQDLSTEAGREAFAALMGVAGAFAELTNASVAAFAEAENLAAFAEAENLAGLIREGLLGNIAAEDLGGQMADVVMTGMYNAIAGGFAEQITQIMMQGVINPVIQAAITGAAMSEVVSQAAIDRMVADAVRVAEALGAILDDPAFRDAMGRIESAVTSIGSSIARPEPVYVSHDARRQEAERARQEAERARQEAERARQQAIDEAAREQQRIANERLGLMKQLLQLEGNQAALRQIELEALDPSNRALQERIWALQDAAEAEAKHAAALKEANDFLKNVTSNIRSFVAGLNTQTSNPAVNYQQAWAAYNTQLAFAQGGDRDALSNITGYASTLAEAIRQSAQTGAEADLLIGRMRGQLMALPERVSAEQLIVNAVEDMKNTLSGVLVQKFDQLDSNVDGLLTFDELKASGMASDDQIRALIARVDANGDGMISRQEATAANVLGVTTAVNTGTTSSEYWSNILNNNNASGFSGVRGRVGDVDNSVRLSNDMLEHGGYTLADYAGLNHVLLSYLRTRFDSAFDSFNTGLTVKSMHRGGEWMTFAHGGVFTNSIVSSPTAFRMGLMGEAGPEAIMPLARTSGGELGVRAIPDGGAGVAPLLAEMAALRAEVSALRAEARAQASAQVGMSKRAAVAGERVARVVDDWDRNGQPEQREEVTA